MKKIVTILGVASLICVVGVSETFARSLNTNTATINSPDMGLSLDAGTSSDFASLSVLIAHFAQDGTDSFSDGYAPSGAPGALTSNPDGCTITTPADVGLMAAGSNNNCGYKSADPQTAGGSGPNSASGLIVSSIAFAVNVGAQDEMRTINGVKAFDHFAQNGLVEFEMVPSASGGTIEVFKTEFTQDMDIYTRDTTATPDTYIAGNQAFMYDFDADTIATDCGVTPANCYFSASNNSDTAIWSQTAASGIKTSQGFAQNMNVGSTNRVVLAPALTSYTPDGSVLLPYPAYGNGDVFLQNTALSPVGCAADTTNQCTVAMGAPGDIMELVTGNGATNNNIVNLIPPGF